MTDLPAKIVQLELLRPTLGDDFVDRAIDALREQAQAQQRIEATTANDNIQVSAGGDVTISVGEQPPDTAALLGHARASLDRAGYRVAQSLCEGVLQREPANACAHLLWAVASLKGTYADQLLPRDIEPVEDSLLSAVADPELAATAWTILGIIRVDFYKRTSRPIKRFPMPEIRRLLREADPAKVDQALLRAVRATDAAVKEVFRAP